MNAVNDVTKLDWNKVNGLLPVIIQDSKTLQVLMLGYMNKEAIEMTDQTKKVTFYSRTKKRLWTKGEISGNELIVVSMHIDCDLDSLLILVKPKGLTCHLNQPSCFNTVSETQNLNILMNLTSVIEKRFKERPKNSYVTQLFEQGVERIAQKVGEEGVELALAGVIGKRENIKNEAADLIFHLLVLLKVCEVNLTDVLSELYQRAEEGHPDVRFGKDNYS